MAEIEQISVSGTVYDLITNTPISTAQPSGGMEPNTLYNLGTLSGSVTISFATASSSTIMNEYMFTFDTDTTAPTVTFPASITSWSGNCLNNGAPQIAASKHYEVSVVGGYGLICEF